jgi:GNAT superfamily N-acetyltransferase
MKSLRSTPLLLMSGRVVQALGAYASAGGIAIRAVRADELQLLIEIERAARESFRSLGMDAVADDDPGSVAKLAPYADDGRAFVAVDATDGPLGSLLLDVVDGAAHVEQVTVHPDHARRWIGRSLIESAQSWGARPGPAGAHAHDVRRPWPRACMRRDVTGSGAGSRS